MNDLILTLATEAIKDFLVLQKKVSEAFLQKYPTAKSGKEAGFSTPEKKGFIIVDDDKWSFSKHGSGVFFMREKDSLEIDNDRCFEQFDLFDTGRLSTYIDSKSKAELDSSEFNALFDLLLNKKKIENVHDYLYRLI